MPLVRADGLSTQHMRSLTYALTAPELEEMTSLQVTGTEWTAHLTSIRKLAEELRPGLNGGFHPSRSIFHGMVSSQKRTVTSSAGAQLIDELTDWLDEQIDADASAARGTPQPSVPRTPRRAGRARLLPAARDDARHRLRARPSCCATGASAGTSRARRRGARRAANPRADSPSQDPAYRFAVVQSELYRRHLRLAVDRFDLRPLALYLRHLTQWHLEAARGEHVERIVQTLLERSARGLGLEAA